MLGWLVSRFFGALRAATASAAVVGALHGAHGHAASADGATLHAVQERGFLRCGVHRSGVGLADVNADGYWSGYFVEFCRIVAAATVGDAEAVRLVEVDDASAVLALTQGLADVVVSMPDAGEPGRPVDGPLVYLSPILEDRLMLIPAGASIHAITDLQRGARICTGSHDAYRGSLQRALGDRISSVEMVWYESIEGLFNAFFRQRCGAIGYHSFAIRSQGVLRAPNREQPVLQGIDLGPVAFRPAVGGADAAWAGLLDRILRVALFDPQAESDGGRGAFSAGQIQRIRAIATSPGAVFGRTLGHDGGQGFEPVPPVSGS